MTHWIWQTKDWPNFYWDSDSITRKLAQARLQQGKLLGYLSSLKLETREDIHFNALVDEITTSSAIEGEIIDRESVRSSLRRRLGLLDDNSTTLNRYIDGVVDMMNDAMENYQTPLSLELIMGWQAALFPEGYSGIKKINVGMMRGEGEMKIVSGHYQRQKTHYIAPPRNKLDDEMVLFIDWFNGAESQSIDGILRAATAHLWFELLHPFDDGNGRVGRSIIEMALSQDEKLNERYYSVSNQILSDRKNYYLVLEDLSKAPDLDISRYLLWFIKIFHRSIETTFENIEFTMVKTKFWQQHVKTNLNERQKKVLNKMLDKGRGNFEGGINTRKYAGITKTSKATAFRDLNDLVHKGCLAPIEGAGRSSAYDIVWPKKKSS